MDGEDGRVSERAAIGRRLEQARKDRGLSLEEVERAIKVHARHLEALERGDPEALPNPAWAYGFLVMYATYLGLGEEVPRPDGEAAAPEPVGPSRAPWVVRRLLDRWPWLAALGATVLAAAMIVAMVLAPYNAFIGRVTDLFDSIVPGLFLESGPQRVAVIGSAGEGASRTDNIMVAKVAEDDLGLLAIPRNTLAEVPGGRGTRDIGGTFSLGGPDLTRRTAAQLTGTEVPHYLTVSAQGVGEIVESMGGVRVDVPETTTSRASIRGPEITLRPGPQTLGGDQALVYYLGEDAWGEAERTKRQLDLLYAVYRQAFGPSNLVSDPATVGVVFENTDTNMSPVETLQVVGRIRTSKDSGVPLQTGTVPGRERPIREPQEGARVAAYWVPDPEKLSAVLEETVR
ncbi:MAG: LCP family protein [Rubrobacter sp.]